MADRLAAAVVIVLCVVALSLVASSLSATSQLERGPGEGSGPGASDSPAAQPPPTNETGSGPIGVSGDWVAVLLALFVALGLPSLFVIDRHRALGLVLFVVLLLGAAAIASYFADGFTYQPPDALGLENASSSLQGGGDYGQADQATDDRSRSLPSMLTFGALGLALVMAVGVVFYASSSVDESVDPEPDASAESDGAPAVAAAAGRAADHIDDHEGDLSNAVYEAWREMTTTLDVADPATSTPGEFAEAAVAAGMDGGRVAELTDLFEVVRYGGEEPTAEHERRAVETLRAIEAEYEAVDASGVADAEAGAPPDGGDGADDSPSATGGDGT